VNPFPYRITILRQTARRRTGDVRRWPYHPSASAALVAAALGGIGLVGATPASASGTSGGTTASINVAAGAVRSVTVSPSATTFTACASSAGASSGTTLVFPNGTCLAGPVTITNGSQPGHIDVQGSDAVPSDNGTRWTLCLPMVGAPVVPCTGTANPLTPGADQFAEEANTANGTGSPPLTNNPQCDTAFSAACAASSGQSASETLILLGPQSSSDPSASFTTVWTWTAVP
jgi:hypothetical protein